VALGHLGGRDVLKALPHRCAKNHRQQILGPESPKIS